MHFLAIVLALCTAAACQDRPEAPSERIGMGKTIEADEDFLATRDAHQRQSRARLDRLNARINDLGDDVSVRLRAERDELAMRIEKIDEQGETEWDRFRSELDRAFADVERLLRRD